MTDHTGNSKYGLISMLARYVLLIPHSNAACERSFSHVRKIKMEFRPTMGPETLSAICVIKEGMGGACYETQVTKENTTKAKSCTMEALKNKMK